MSAKQGYIYVTSSPAMQDGIYKIGATTKQPIERIKELSAAVGVPIPFALVYSRSVNYPFAVEAELHRHFERYRLNDKREFFSLPLADIIQAIEGYEHACEMPLPWSELFASFPDDGDGRELTEEEREKCADLAFELKYNNRR